MRFSGHFYIRLFSVSLLLYFLVSLPPSLSQERPADAAEISRNLLFLGPSSIETGAAETVFHARAFTYKFTPASGWSVARNGDAAGQAEVRRKKVSLTLGGEDYTLTGASDDERATLELRRSGAAEPLATAVLWTREQLVTAWLPVLQRQLKSLTAAKLSQDLEVGDPVLYAVEAAGDSLWVGVGHSTGEGELGIGTLVRFDVKTREAAVFQPQELATCAVTHLVVSGPDSLLLGTRRQNEGVVRPCSGLVRFHPSTRQLEKIAPAGSPLEGAVVTALRGTWVATGKGICASPADGTWNCWRIVPTVTLAEPMLLTNKPGEKSGASAKPGDYEVLWANAAFFEIATKDSYDAWLAADDLADAAARNFDAEPWKLLNTSEGPAPIRPLVKPGGDPLEGTLVYRAPLEKLPAAPGAPAGFVKVRIRAGWIERGALEVVPKLVPVEPPQP
jgi:hypothetical protein